MPPTRACAPLVLGAAAVLAGCGWNQPRVGADAAVTDAPRPPDAAAAPDAHPHACAPDAVAGHQAYACPGGITAEVEVPAACLAGGCGVVLDLHGYAMTADQQDGLTRLRTLATARGYVVVQPSAPGAPPSWGTDGALDPIVWDLLDAVVDVLAIDPDRVHVTGFSQGAMMTYRLLCAHADRIASIAPIAGADCFDVGGAPAVERPILHVHGHLDAVAAWASIAVPQRDAILATWDFGAPTALPAGASYAATRWTTAAGTPFELWEHDLVTGDAFAGHCLPGPAAALLYRCAASTFDATAVVLDFFDAHPRR